MSTRYVLRLALALSFVLPASSGFSQALPTTPPGNDPTIWGRENVPYTLKLTVTGTSVDGNGMLHTHVGVSNVFRDSAGRVREESFYDNGRPMGVSIKDPVKNTMTIMHLVDKRAIVIPLQRPTIPPPGRGWTVERLPSRVIDGIAADGFRFTRTLPPPPEGSAVSATLSEEDWIATPLGVVLERTSGRGTANAGTQSVSQFKQVEPDPALFKIDLSGYSVQQLGTLAH